MTDADGAFRLQVDRRMEPFEVRVSARGYFSPAVRHVETTTTDLNPFALKAFVLEPKPPVSIVLVDESGDLVLDSDWTLTLVGESGGNPQFRSPDAATGACVLDPRHLHQRRGPLEVRATHPWATAVHLRPIPFDELRDRPALRELRTPVWEHSLRLKLVPDGETSLEPGNPQLIVQDAMGELLSRGRVIGKEVHLSGEACFLYVFEGLPTGRT